MTPECMHVQYVHFICDCGCKPQHIHNAYIWVCTPVPLWMWNIHFVYYCGSLLTFPLASTMHDKRVGCELVHNMPIWQQVHTQHCCWHFISIWLIFALKSHFVISKSILVGFFGPTKPTKLYFSMTKFDFSAKTNQMLAKRQQQYSLCVQNQIIRNLQFCTANYYVWTWCTMTQILIVN